MAGPARRFKNAAIPQKGPAEGHSQTVEKFMVQLTSTWVDLGERSDSVELANA